MYVLLLVVVVVVVVVSVVVSVVAVVVVVVFFVYSFYLGSRASCLPLSAGTLRVLGMIPLCSFVLSFSLCVLFKESAHLLIYVCLLFVYFLLACAWDACELTSAIVEWSTLLYTTNRCVSRLRATMANYTCCVSVRALRGNCDQTQAKV